MNTSNRLLGMLYSTACGADLRYLYSVELLPTLRRTSMVETYLGSMWTIILGCLLGPQSQGRAQRAQHALWLESLLIWALPACTLRGALYSPTLLWGSRSALG